MFDADKYIAEYQDMEHGAARLRVMKNAIVGADEAKAAEWQFVFRHEYLNESIFECDNIDAMVVFPEMLAIYDAHPELAEEHQHDLMWDFKNILSTIAQFPQVPLSEIEKYFDEFEKRCKKYGFTMRSAKYEREKYSETTGNYLPLSEYGSYAKEEADALKDCPACEANWNVACELLRDNREEAEKISQPLFDGRLKCAEMPEATYARWIEYLSSKGAYIDAKIYAKRLYPMIRDRITMLDEVGDLMRFYAQYDRHIGTNIFRHEVKNYPICRNLWMKMKFAKGAYHLFKNMEQESVVLVLPREFPLFHEEHSYESAELRDYFYEEAKKLAERFDARDGNSHYMDDLNLDYPAYDEAKDFVHGDAEMEVSVLGAVCTKLPETLTLESVSALMQQDGRFHAELMRVNEENNSLQFQIFDEDALYQVLLAVQPVPNLEGLRPASPIGRSVPQAVEQAEGTILCIMPFEEHQPDIALHFQMKFLHLICPEAVVYVDYTRMKLLPSRWVALTAESSVPPLVDYLYSLRTFGGDDGEVWIMTSGMNSCGMRELEIWDATEENYPRLADLLCFTAERFLLRGELPDAKTPFTALQREDGSPVQLAWLPASEAIAYYQGNNCGAAQMRSDMLGDDAFNFEGNAVLFLYDGENADGSVKLKRLGTLTEEDFDSFRYGQYIVSSRKNAAMARERYGIFREAFAQRPEEAYACVYVETDDSEDEVWMKVSRAEENRIYGELTDDCLAGNQGDLYEAEVGRLLNFSLKNGELYVQPNTAYLFE